jgi:phage shock protein A
MSVSLARRIRTLLRADAHGLVESLEERSLMLKQYVREAELELVRKRARADTLAEEEKRLRDELGRSEQDAQEIDADVGMALEGGEEDLARFALRRLLTLRARTKVLRAEIAGRTSEREALEERLRDQEVRFEALRTQVRAELTRPDPPSCHGADEGEEGWLGMPAVADEEVEIELMRRRSERRAAGDAS